MEKYSRRVHTKGERARLRAPHRAKCKMSAGQHTGTAPSTENHGNEVRVAWTGWGRADCNEQRGRYSDCGGRSVSKLTLLLEGTCNCLRRTETDGEKVPPVGCHTLQSPSSVPTPSASGHTHVPGMAFTAAGPVRASLPHGIWLSKHRT